MPTPPATINAGIIAYATADAPGLTVLPGNLIEDMSSTATAAVVGSDQARVDLVNSVTPYGANAYILLQQGQMLGVPPGLGSNGSVDVTFAGSPGYVIPAGFLVGDGTNQYAVQPPGGVIQSNGYSSPLYCIATNSNTFAIPAGAVDVTITTVPSPYMLTCTNASAGIPAIAAQSTAQYRAQILQAQQVAVSGVATYIKTLVQLVPGVNPLYIRVFPVGIYWEVVVGGGDPYAVAQAIYKGVSSTGLLIGSQINSGRNINVTLFDAPDSYNVVYVAAQAPPGSGCTVAVIWNTQLANFTAVAAVNQYIIAATQSYVNGLQVGQGLNLLVLTETIQEAVTPVLSPANLTTLEFTVTVNGVPVGPSAGTSVIPAIDAESYFYISPTQVTSTQG